jgi:hypothetical protein
MVPHSLFVSADRHVDLALNLLTLVVTGALVTTLAYLLFMWVRPIAIADRGDVGPPTWASMSELLAPHRLEFEFQLPHLPVIYRCEYRGEVTYSDRPCKAGRVSAVAIRPS